MDLQGKKVIVLGGSGFIGSHLVEGLLGEGCNVKVIDDLFTGKKSFLENVIDKIDFIEGSITDSALLEKEFKDIDFVFHEAALISVRESVGFPLNYNKVNINGTVKVLEAAKNTKVKRIVFASSSSVYGDSTVLPQKEIHEKKPSNPYALSKLAGELYLKIYYDLFNLETISLRYFNVFGPRQNPKGQYAAVIPLFAEKLINNEKPTVFGDGKQSRDFVFVKDVVRANIIAMKASSDACGKVFNVGSGKAISLLELIDKINDCLKTNIKPNHANPILGDVRKTLSDQSLTKKELGFECVYSFENGLKTTVDYLEQRIGKWKLIF